MKKQFCLLSISLVLSACQVNNYNVADYKEVMVPTPEETKINLFNTTPLNVTQEKIVKHY